MPYPPPGLLLVMRVRAGKTSELSRLRRTWYAVSGSDQTASPELQRLLAKRMKATTVELEAGHLSPVSHPREIANIILDAAGKPHARP